jgi:hypothetical protein
MSYSKYKFKNRYIIGEKGRFQTVSDAITWLESNMTEPSELLIDGTNGINVSDTIVIDLPYHLSIRGFDSASVTLKAATGLTNKPMFQLTSEVWIERVYADGSTLASYGTQSTENFIEVLGTEYYEITAIHAKGFYDGVRLIGEGSLWIFNSIYEDLTGSGVCVFSDGETEIDVETNTFQNCGNAVCLDKSTAGEWHIINNLFKMGSSGQNGIKYTPATYILTDDPVASGNTWNNVGTFSTGFDYSRADGRDANVYVVGNSGREDKKPHFNVSVVNNSTQTTITTAGTFYKVAFTNGDIYTCKWTMADNQYTYQPRNSSDVPVWVAGNVQVNGTNKNVDICIRKNNETNYSTLTVRCAVANQPYAFSLCAYIPDMAETDYIEIWATSSTNGDIIILQDLSMYADSK